MKKGINKTLAKNNLDLWAKLKSDIYFQQRVPFFKEREIWWAAIGFNIGDEQNGKNTYFERPVLILKRFYRTLFLCLPITSKRKEGNYYFGLSGEKIDGDVILSQGRVIDSKRLLRKVETIDVSTFQEILEKYKDLI